MVLWLQPMLDLVGRTSAQFCLGSLTPFEVYNGYHAEICLNQVGH
jgi:hypothetical protein